MVDLFGLKQEPEPEAVAVSAPSGGGRKLWAALLALDSALFIICGGALAKVLYQHLNAPAAAGKALSRKPPAPAATPPASAPQQPSSQIIEEPAPAAVPKEPRIAAAAVRPEEKRHSVPVEFKLKAARARNVRLVGAFIVRGGHRDMVQEKAGLWTLTLYLLPGNNYRYWFSVDGKKTLDPNNPKRDRGASVWKLP